MRQFMLAAALCLSQWLGAQTGQVEQLAVNFFDAVKFNDAPAFAKCFIDNKDLYQLMYRYVQRQDSVAKDSIKEIIMPEMEVKLMADLKVLKQRFRDSGVNWEQAKYINCYYNLLKDKSSVFPSLTGEIIFESGGKKYALIIGAAVFIHNNWKLVSFRTGYAAPGTLAGVSYYLEKDGFFKNMAYSGTTAPAAKPRTAPVKLAGATPVLKKQPTKRSN